MAPWYRLKVGSLIDDNQDMEAWVLGKKGLKFKNLRAWRSYEAVERIHPI